MNPERKAWAVMLAVFLASVLLFWSFRLGSLSLVAPYMIALGFISNLLPPAFFTLAPETMGTSMAPETTGRQGDADPRIRRAGAQDPAFASMALATILAGSNVGALAGPPILGALLSARPWTWGSTCLGFVAILGTIVALIAGHTMNPRRRHGAIHRL